MLTIPIDGDLERRLRAAAGRLRKRPEECALAALSTWLEACEEAARNAAQLGGESVLRPPEEFWD